MGTCRRIVLYISFLYILAGQTGCMLVYFHNYFVFDRAYDLCRRNDMRLLRVDNDGKLQTVAKFAEGLKNFTMSTGALRLSQRYDVNSSRHLWPDGTVSTLATAWDSEEPKSPETLQCVSQINDKWKTSNCTDVEPFICETGYALDPAIEMDTFYNYPVFKTFRRLRDEPATKPGQLMTPFKEEENSLDMYRGFRVNLMEECSIWCTMDPVCKGITYTTNKALHRNVCILLK